MEDLTEAMRLTRQTRDDLCSHTLAQILVNIHKYHVSPSTLVPIGYSCSSSIILPPTKPSAFLDLFPASARRHTLSQSSICSQTRYRASDCVTALAVPGVILYLPLLSSRSSHRLSQCGSHLLSLWILWLARLIGWRSQGSPFPVVWTTAFEDAGILVSRSYSNTSSAASLISTDRLAVSFFFSADSRRWKEMPRWIG